MPRVPLLALAAALVLALALTGTAGARSYSKKAIWGPVEQNGKSSFPIFQDLGAQIWEVPLNWAGVAPNRPANPTDPSDPAYLWPPELDQAMTEARNAHMRVSFVVTTAPTWANGKNDPTYAPIDPEDFAAFTAAAAKKYPDVRLWQLWPEASREEVFKPLIPEHRDRPLTAAMKRAPHKYAEMVDDSYGALKNVNRSNIVIAGGTFTTGDVSALNWIKNLRLPNGKPPRMDMYGHNPYTTRTPNFKDPPLGHGFADFSDLPVLAKWIDRYLRKGVNKRMKFFLSEFSAPTDHKNFEFNFHVTKAVQAKWATAAFKLARKWSRIYALGWYSLYDDAPRPDHLEVNRGLLTYAGRKKPAYNAYKNG
jgi:hypothetical protein